MDEEVEGEIIIDYQEKIEEEDFVIWKLTSRGKNTNTFPIFIDNIMPTFAEIQSDSK